MITLLTVLVLSAAVVPTHYVSWEHSGTDIQGQPESISAVQYAISFDGQGPESPLDSWTRALTPTQPGKPVFFKHDITEHVNNLQTGLKYRIHARVQDTAGNWSVWVTSDTTLDLVTPQPPTKLKS